MQSLKVNIQFGSNQGTLNGQQGQLEIEFEFDHTTNTNLVSIGILNMTKML
jgi:hypothetical protein